jgi:hypothetical protein
MSIHWYILLLSILFFVRIESKSPANSKVSERINHLLNITEAEKKFKSVLEAYITNDPNLSSIKSQVMSFINKFLSFKSLRPHIVEIYRDLYTLSDINGLIKFYSTALGKRLIEKESKAEIRLTELIKSQLEKQMPQIISWFQQELTRAYSIDQLNQTLQGYP